MSELEASEEYVRDGRIGRILNEYLDRRARGQAEPEAELLARHPELADDLRSHLEMLRELAPDRSKIDALVAQGVLQESADPRYAAEFGPYQITGWIGHGGMGIVLEAYEESLDRTVALKILKPDLVEDEAAVVRFAREAKAAAGLHHPNIITVHAVGQERDVHFLAMEYIGGPTLGQLIRQRGPLPTETIRRFFGEILSALACAHEAGLIHRDIKSSNILLDEPWTSARADVRHDQAELGCGATSQSPIANPQSPIVKLADFGLARMLSARTRMTTTGSVLGTPEYMSPEQARGDTELDHRTDLYSAGVVLYEMLTGQTPFKADTPSAVIHRIVHEEPPNPRTINKEADPTLASLTLRLMAKLPQDRFDSASGVIPALRTDKLVSLSARRRRVRRYAVAAVGVLALVLGSAWLLARSQAPSTATDATTAAEPVITKVWSTPNDPDPALRTIVWANYSDGRTKVPFHEFDADAGSIEGVGLMDRYGDGTQVIVGGVSNPLEDGCIFAFDPHDRELWHLDMSSDRQWPICSPPARFGCDGLAVGDLDGVPGDELAVVANDHHEYAGRASIIDPRTRRIRSTFWHMGRLHDVRILPGYFEAARPALLVWGVANTLDGFSDGLRAGERTYTQWDIVQVMMILDPADMDGLGPPRTGRVPDLEPARVHAYAFLDLAINCAGRYQPWDKRADTDCEIRQVARFTAVTNTRWEPTDSTGPWFELRIEAQRQDDTRVARDHLIVDRDLRLRRVVAPGGATDVTGETFEYWQDHWRPIILDGEYVDEAAGQAARSAPPL